MRVLAIDPAVRNTGYAVLEGDPRKPAVLGYDVISIPQRLCQSAGQLHATEFLPSSKTSNSVGSLKAFNPNYVLLNIFIVFDWDFGHHF